MTNIFKIKKKKKKPLVLINNTEKNDDWMKTLPSYKAEEKIHNRLSRKNKKKTPPKKRKGKITKKR